MPSRMFTIQEASAYLTERLGVRVPVPTLREWRKTWATQGARRRGPRPLLITDRKLRYLQTDCDAFVRQRLGG